MRVAWDLQAVTGPGRTGLGVSVQFLLDALTAHAPEVEVAGLRPNDTDSALARVPDRIGWEQWRLPAALHRTHRATPLDLCYSPALGAPLRSPVPVMAHVHDLIPLHYPQLFSGAAARFYWCQLLPATWRRCRALTVSNASVAEDIEQHLRYPRERIHIVPYYPDPAVARTAVEMDPDYAAIAVEPVPTEPLFITLGTHERRKNIESAVRAVSELHRRGISARLCCIGGRTPLTESLQTLARNLGIADWVDFPGYLDRRETVRLLLDCTALVFMSHYEGYGMPPQEAQSIGCAVVLSNIPCHRTVYHDETRWTGLGPGKPIRPALIDPRDDRGLAGELQRLVEDPAYRMSLRSSGLRYCATFSPAATAAALQRAFESVLTSQDG